MTVDVFKVSTVRDTLKASRGDFRPLSLHPSPPSTRDIPGTEHRKRRRRRRGEGEGGREESEIGPHGHSRGKRDMTRGRGRRWVRTSLVSPQG